MRSERSSKFLPCGRPFPKEERTGLELRKLESRLQAYVKEKELKQSETRIKILGVIVKRARHFTAPDLVKQVHQGHAEIGAATVYRTLPVLVNSGILRDTLSDETGQKIFELAQGEHHDHIVCLDCDRIFEFHEEVIEEAQERVSSRLSFDPASHRHVIYAHCKFRK